MKLTITSLVLTMFSLSVFAHENEPSLNEKQTEITCHVAGSAPGLKRWVERSFDGRPEALLKNAYKTFNLKIDHGFTHLADMPEEEKSKRLLTFSHENRRLIFAATGMGELQVQEYANEADVELGKSRFSGYYSNFEGSPQAGGITGFIEYDKLAFVCYKI